MSLAVVFSRALLGIEAPQVCVEVHLGAGLPTFTIVGLPDAEVREAKDRVRAALNHAGLEFPARRITVNLAPADLPKNSSRLDLPIAMGILAASGQVPVNALDAHEFVGELSLTGELRGVRGALAMAIAAREAKHRLVLPHASVNAAQLANGAYLYPANTLLEVCAHLSGHVAIEPVLGENRVIQASIIDGPDLSDVHGQAHARRTLEIAAAGGHSLLMLGPPGAGKSMLAARLPSVLPALTEQEALEVAAVHSAANLFQANAWGKRPYRSPHHSASATALVGGGALPRPGEISLAHRGVLFLDELTEFSRHVLESLREPLEMGSVVISRATRSVQFPAAFQLIAAMNPCPCGYLGHESGRCMCTPDRVRRYRSRLSGPLADRIDLKIEVPALPAQTLIGAKSSESSHLVRQRVEQARQQQLARQGCINAHLTSAQIIQYCTITPAAEQLARVAIERLSLSARAYHRILRVARSIADLAQSTSIDTAHVAEAVQYRRLDSTF